MSVSLEKIDMLMERANISYKEAKEALEKHNGDMVEALIELESSHRTALGPKNQRQQRHQKHQNERDFFEDVKVFIQKMHKTSFIFGRKGHKVLDIPLTIAALIILFTLPVSIFLLILPYFMGYKIVILDENGKKMKFEQSFQFGNDQDDRQDEDEDRRQ